MEYWRRFVKMNEVITVSRINNLIKAMLESDYALKNLQISGEVSNLTKHSTGHWYFTLKDDKSQISAIMFASYASKVTANIQDGDKVVVTADIGVYAVSGRYQLMVRKIEPVGQGALFVEFEKLKAKLSAEGLFDPTHKVAIPKYCTNICVITAPNMAAIQDVITTAKRRWPIVKLTLIPALVQGKGSKESLIAALRAADPLGFDVIIFGRGGGSIEDLWSFNEEEVARQLYMMKTPIVSAVGHDIDYTISDFVADVRAATPTAAAELVTPNKIDVIQQLQNYESRITTAFFTQLNEDKALLEHYKTSHVLTSPEELYAAKQMALDLYKEKILNSQTSLCNNLKHNLEQTMINLRNGLINNINTKKSKFEVNKSKIEALSPLNVLDRGYGIATIDGKVVDSIAKVKIDDTLVYQVKDGYITNKVIKKEAKNHE